MPTEWIKAEGVKYEILEIQSSQNGSGPIERQTSQRGGKTISKRVLKNCMADIFMLS